MFLFEGGNDNNSNEIGCVFDTKLVVYIFGDGGGVGVGAGKADARAWRGWVGAYNRSSPPSPSFFFLFFLKDVKLKVALVMTVPVFVTEKSVCVWV